MQLRGKMQVCCAIQHGREKRQAHEGLEL
jgi:hypothetical protein